MISILGVVLMSGFAASTSAPYPNEMADARRWVSSAFGLPEAAATNDSGLVIQRNLNEVCRNGRVGRPLMVGKTAYHRGLFCHAQSIILVRLPGRGQRFSAFAGVDTNGQTQGGQGSIVFSVRLGESEAFRSLALREGMPAVPVSVDLNGATEFVIEVGDAGDGVSCDQADWADARVILEDGRTLWLGDLPILEGQPEPAAHPGGLPFSFQYGDRSSRDLLSSMQATTSTRPIDASKTEHTLTWRDSGTGLEVRCVLVE